MNRFEKAIAYAVAICLMLAYPWLAFFPIFLFLITNDDGGARK